MELKRILARDSRSANEKAIQLYGDDVLIISTQRVGDQTELIIAIDGEGAAAAKPAQAKFQSLDASIQQEKHEVFAEIFGFVQRQEEQSQALARPEPVAQDALPQAQPVVTQDPATTDAPVQKARKPKTVKKSASTSDKRAPASSPRAASKRSSDDWPDWLQQEMARSREIVDVLRQEIHILRQEISLGRQMQPWRTQLNMAPELSALADAMTHLGVPAGLRALLTETIASCGDAQEALQAMRKVMLSALKPASAQVMAPGVHVLMGACGVGKTSMAIRCIHHLMAHTQPEDHAVIGFSDHRPGAWSQLQMLAAGVGVEAYRAKDLDALGVLLNELSSRTYIWIDTPGQAHFEMAAVLSQAYPDAMLHAVVPMDASVAHLQRLRQSPIPLTGVLVSKADEPHPTWQWLQALAEHPIAIDGLSIDPQVQVPLSSFDPQDWVDAALNMLVPQTSPKPSRQSAGSRPKRSRSQKEVHA